MVAIVGDVHDIAIVDRDSNRERELAVAGPALAPREDETGLGFRARWVWNCAAASCDDAGR